jgi:hypothetical protein
VWEGKNPIITKTWPADASVLEESKTLSIVSVEVESSAESWLREYLETFI